MLHHSLLFSLFIPVEPTLLSSAKIKRTWITFSSLLLLSGSQQYHSWASLWVLCHYGNSVLGRAVCTASMLMSSWLHCPQFTPAYCPTGPATWPTQVQQHQWVCIICSAVCYVNNCVCVCPVFLALVERMLGQKLPRRGSNRVMVTIFQLWSYLEVNGISDMETHITELAEEGITHKGVCLRLTT